MSFGKNKLVYKAITSTVGQIFSVLFFLVQDRMMLLFPWNSLLWESSMALLIVLANQS